MTDRDHINNLLGRYCRGVANFDRDEWGSTWAEDGRWTFPDGNSVVGRAAIVETFAEARTRFPLCVQQVTSTVIDVDGDTGTGWVRHAASLSRRGQPRSLSYFFDDAHELVSDRSFESSITTRDFKIGVAYAGERHANNGFAISDRFGDVADRK